MRYLLIAVLAFAAENPNTIPCDVHNATFIRNGTITRDGKCYDRYTHGYSEGFQQRTHEALLRCAGAN